MPCRAVGGDFFDYVDLPTGEFGFIVGDVAGKGSPAALLAAAVLGMFSAEATYQAGAAPLITRLNRGLFRRAIEARFLTSVLRRCSAPDGSLTYSQRRPQRAAAGARRQASAASKPAASCSACSSTRRSSEETVTLEPGDLIVAFSDGVTEAMNEAGEEFSDDRLHRAACANAHGKTRSRCSTRCSRTCRRSAGDALQSDDVTMMAVRYEG